MTTLPTPSSPDDTPERQRASKVGRRGSLGRALAASGLAAGLVIGGAQPASADAGFNWIIEGPPVVDVNAGGRSVGGGLKAGFPYGILTFAVEGEGLKVDSVDANFRPYNIFNSVSGWKLDFHYAQYDSATGEYREVARYDDELWHGSTGSYSVERIGPGHEFPEGTEGVACVTFTWKMSSGTLQETHCHKIKPARGGVLGWLD